MFRKNERINMELDFTSSTLDGVIEDVLFNQEGELQYLISTTEGLFLRFPQQIKKINKSDDLTEIGDAEALYAVKVKGEKDSVGKLIIWKNV